MESERANSAILRKLVVASDRVIRESLTELLRVLKHDPTPISNSTKALIQLEPDRFDLVLVSCSSTNPDSFRDEKLLTEGQAFAVAKLARASDRD